MCDAKRERARYMKCEAEANDERTIDRSGWYDEWNAKRGWLKRWACGREGEIPKAVRWRNIQVPYIYSLYCVEPYTFIHMLGPGIHLLSSSLCIARAAGSTLLAFILSLNQSSCLCYLFFLRFCRSSPPFLSLSLALSCSLILSSFSSVLHFCLVHYSHRRS